MKMQMPTEIERRQMDRRVVNHYVEVDRRGGEDRRAKLIAKFEQTVSVLEGIVAADPRFNA